jgi:multicomponent Na+:H+ antiporter subunit A
VPPADSRFHPHPLILVPLALSGLTAWLLASARTPWTVSHPWVPSLGVDLAFHLDGLSLLMLALIAGIGLAVFTYAAAYMTSVAARTRLLALLTAFMLAMAGAVTTDNLVVLFVFWELTSVTSFLLVGFKHDYEPNRQAARQALLITAGGGLVLLAGVLFLGSIFGTYSIQALIARAPDRSAHPLLPAALGCVFVGAFSKSAQWPFHFWLPNAMAAPTPVSAYLHSATMVKLGVYLLARLNPAFERLLLWEVTLVSVGAITALWAMVLALRERDLKRILAWSTVSSLGTLVLLIGLPGPGAAEATAAFLLAHALYKAPLFFVAGNVDHSAGTRSIDRLAGMARVMPWTAATALLAGLSMAGVPLSFGYVAKDFIAIAKTEGLSFKWVSYATMVAGAISVAVASVAAIRVFWHRGGRALPAEIHEASAGMLAPPLAVASVSTLLGMMPALALPLIQDAASAITNTTRSGAVPLVPGTSGMPTTLLVFALGLAVFLGWDRLHVWMEALRWFDRFGLAAVYGRSLERIPTTAGFVTTRLQHGQLPAYLALVIIVFAIATAGAMAGGPALAWPAWSAPAPAVAAATVLIISTSIAACRIRDPFVLLLLTGLAGLGSAIIALFVGAPDVAFTQFAVEVAFVVVVAAVLLRVRACAPPSDPAARAGGRAIAGLVVGALVGVLTLAAAAGPGDPALPQYFGERALPDAHGRNVANVIIVDFRALDTLGEIAVVAFTFVGILPLLHWLRAAGRPDQADE